LALPAAPPPTPPPPTARAQGFADQPLRHFSPSPPPQSPQLPLDLDRLTDDIVHRIDRRITAHRERLGRI
ncbi:hypothetical protein KJZ88_02265, partial [Streptomyces sp. Tu102]|nr:hypothetical protein [Streptomyces sp. Tu102]